MLLFNGFLGFIITSILERRPCLRQIRSRLLCPLITGGPGRASFEDACWVSLSWFSRDTGRKGADRQISHVEVDPEHNGNLFFWHFQNRHIANRQRTIIWLNGGPGCSSMDGALMEVGPYRLKNDNTLEYNEGSWDEFANMLFVDQPVGTGFSYVNTDSYLHELDEMSAQFVTFLEKWFELFPEYERDDVGHSPSCVNPLATCF